MAQARHLEVTLPSALFPGSRSKQQLRDSAQIHHPSPEPPQGSPKGTLASGLALSKLAPPTAPEWWVMLPAVLADTQHKNGLFVYFQATFLILRQLYPPGDIR